jgi:hypothetical protein
MSEPVNTGAVPTSEIVRGKVQLLHRNLSNRHNQRRTTVPTNKNRATIDLRPELKGRRAEYDAN